MEGDSRGWLHSRRAFLTVGTGAAVTGLLSACSGAKPLRERVRGSGRVSPADLAPLNGLLDVEHHAIAAYAAGIPLLHPADKKAAVQFLAQELAHAEQLAELIRRARGRPNRPLARYDLGHPRGAPDVLALLMRVEQAQLGAYLAAIPRLSSGHVRAAVASIFANDAQHLAMLRWQAGETPVPGALVRA